MEVNSKPGFWEFNKKRITGRPCEPCRNLEGIEPRDGRGCKTKKVEVGHREATNLSVMQN